MNKILSRIIRSTLLLAALSLLGWFTNWYVTVLAITYILYVLIFSIKKERDKYDRKSTTYKVLTIAGMLLFIPGYPTDWLLNMLSSVLFWDKPAKWNELFTGRMIRYGRLKSGPRYRAAYLICKYMLHPIDENHCKFATS